MNVPVTFSNANGVTFGYDGTQVTASFSNTTCASFFANIPGNLFYSSQTVSPSGSTQTVFPFQLPHNISASFIRLLGSLSLGTNTFATLNSASATGTAAQSNTLFAVVYSQGTGANSLSLQSVVSASMPFHVNFSMSLTNSSQFSQTIGFTWGVSGASTTATLTTVNSSATFTQAIANTSAYVSRPCPLDIPFATSLSAGPYWMAIAWSAGASAAGGAVTGGAIGWSANSLYAASQINAEPFFISSGTASSAPLQPGLGSYTTNAINTTASIGLAAVSYASSNPVPFMQMQRFN